jgi:hypothetical protein
VAKLFSSENLPETGMVIIRAFTGYTLSGRSKTSLPSGRQYFFTINAFDVS